MPQSICEAEQNNAEYCSQHCRGFVDALRANCDFDPEMASACFDGSAEDIFYDKFDERASARFLVSFGWISLLTFTAALIRNQVPLLRKLCIPTALIAGVLGFIALQLAPLIASKPRADYFIAFWHTGWEFLAPLAINVVFATLFVGTELPPVKTVLVEGGPHILYGLTAMFAQFCFGYLVTIAMASEEVPEYAGISMPIGFAGGHGTAGACVEPLNLLGWPGGKDWSFVNATTSLIIAVLGGRPRQHLQEYEAARG